MILLHKEESDFEFPSDYQGIVYIAYDDKEAWKFNIIKELNSQGYSLDANLLI